MSRYPANLMAAVLVAGAAAACEPEWTPRSLEPYVNSFGPGDRLWSEQPVREKPTEVVVDAAGEKAYVALMGTFDTPGNAVAVVDLETGQATGRIEVGSAPGGLALHPDGRHLLVLNRLSNFASVIDTETDEVVEQVPTEFYAMEAVFTPDGREAWVTNRWLDAVVRWEVDPTPGSFSIQSTGLRLPVSPNPRDVAISADGKVVAVGAISGLDLTLVDVPSREVSATLSLGAPSNGVAIVGDLLVAATMSASTHHLPTEGPDSDGDGNPGDGTPNVNFQDLQNEIAVFRASTGDALKRYTSDTICCMDYRDVDPGDEGRYAEMLPPREDWIVEGALPEQVTAVERGGRTEVWVTYSASDQMQRFIADPATGALTPDGTFPTSGHAPHGVAVAGDRVLVAHRLSETLGIYDADSGALLHDVVVGDVTGGEFPATDAEIGELFFFVTAPFTIDGDQACSHCHREMGNVDKALSMPLTRYTGRGSRLNQACRGAADTRPWFFESAMDETNFRPVINEFARIENFCCDDYTLWPDGAPAGCADDPPPECATEPNASSLDGFAAVRDVEGVVLHPRASTAPSRNRFFLEASGQVFGRTDSFGDGIYFENLVTGEREPIKLDFDGTTQALGLFLLANTGLPPNPHDPESAMARRGRAIYEDPRTACATCHPAPAFTVSTDVNPGNISLFFGPVVTPNRDEDGTNLDIFSDGFIDSFPLVSQDSCEDLCGPEACAADPFVCDDIRNVLLGATTLRGIWDRSPSMLHDGRAQGLREVLCTPGHPALQPGETGFNERDGVPDTHGGTSHLSPADIDDLIAYILTL